MKKIIYLAFAALMAGCASQETPNALRQKITELKDKHLAMSHEIKELEKKLQSMETEKETKGLIPVLVKELKSEPFAHFFLANGMVELAEEALVNPETNGQIKTIHVTKGQRVNKGDILISLNAIIIENSIAEIKLGLELVSKIYDKQKELWNQNIGSELQYLEAKNNKESLEKKLVTLRSQLDLSYIRAPFAGIVDNIYLKEGELASPGRAILHLVNLEKLKVIADISENMLPKIKKGDMVSITFPTYDLEMSAPISRISNTIDTKTRTIQIEMLLNNQNGMIKPNQMASLKIRDFETNAALVVPSIVVKQDSRGEFLFITERNENGQDIARKLYIESALSFNDQTMIAKGLTEGQKVIVAGFNQIGSGSLVEIR
jgi:RND family efflux transporter MFP subunit